MILYGGLIMVFTYAILFINYYSVERSDHHTDWNAWSARINQKCNADNIFVEINF